MFLHRYAKIVFSVMEIILNANITNAIEVVPATQITK